MKRNSKSFSGQRKHEVDEGNWPVHTEREKREMVLRVSHSVSLPFVWIYYCIILSPQRSSVHLRLQDLYKNSLNIK